MKSEIFILTAILSRPPESSRTPARLGQESWSIQMSSSLFLATNVSGWVLRAPWLNLCPCLAYRPTYRSSLPRNGPVVCLLDDVRSCVVAPRSPPPHHRFQPGQSVRQVGRKNLRRRFTTVSKPTIGGRLDSICVRVRARISLLAVISQPGARFR